MNEIGTGPTEPLAVLASIRDIPDQPVLEYLLAMIPEDWPDEVRVPYSDSARVLSRSFAGTQLLETDTNPPALDVIRMWPILICIEFVNLLDKLHPGALILLAHYCILLRRCEAKAWYARDKAASILSTVMLHLDISWHRYIAWPLNEIGLLPGTSC